MFVFVNILVKELKHLGLTERETYWLNNWMDYWKTLEWVFYWCEIKGCVISLMLKCYDVLLIAWGSNSLSQPQVLRHCTSFMLLLTINNSVLSFFIVKENLLLIFLLKLCNTWASSLETFSVSPGIIKLCRILTWTNLVK